jgi:hypothetical protein
MPSVRAKDRAINPAGVAFEDRGLPPSTSQGRAVLSDEEVSTRWPSGLKTALLTGSECS